MYDTLYNIHLMTNHELDCGGEMASEMELHELADKTMVLLEGRGTMNFDPEAKVYGSMNGIPIADTSAAYGYKLGQEEAYQLAPEAADALELESGLHLIYQLPVYTPLFTDGVQLFYVGPVCEYVQQDADEREHKDYFVEISEENIATSNVERVGGPAQFGPMFSDEARDKAEQAANLEKEMGFNQLSRRECRALTEIVDKLAQEEYSR